MQARQVECHLNCCCKPLIALRILPQFALGNEPNLVALQTCDQTHSLISVSPNWMEDELMLSSYARNAMCSE